jgi:uncharacterized protein (TIGR04551 family)
VNGTAVDPTSLGNGDQVPRGAYLHAFDLWYRMRSSRFLLEAEGVWLVGHIGNASVDPLVVGPRIKIDQLGLVVRASYQVTPSRLTLGGEFGMASGDRAPGFGNRPWQLAADGSLPSYGAMEGPQYDPARGDTSVRNYRFNPAYRPDLILWSQIVGQVTKGFYLKPSLRWDIFAGLALEEQLIYSQSLDPKSTPSGSDTGRGHAPLGVELDSKLSFTADDGFNAWFAWGVLQPLDGFGPGGLKRAHTLQLGLAARF